MTSAVDVYGDLPMLIRRVVSYIKHKVPLLEQIQESIETIEREQIDSPQEAQQYVMNAIQQKMSTTLPEDTHSSVYILILCNI